MNDSVNAHEYGRDLRKRNNLALSQSRLKLTSIKLPRDLIDYYDKQVEDGIFVTRSEAMRYALRFKKDMEENDLKRG